MPTPGVAYNADCQPCTFAGRWCPDHDPALTDYTLVASIIIPNGTDPKPVATLIWPDGEIKRVTLSDHDWAYDSSPTRAPASLYRYLISRGWEGHHTGDVVYESPAYPDSSSGMNERGRLTVYEIKWRA